VLCRAENCRIPNIAIPEKLTRGNEIYPIDECYLNNGGKCTRGDFCNERCRYCQGSVHIHGQYVPDLHCTYCWECYNGIEPHLERNKHVDGVPVATYVLAMILSGGGFD
jgi:hypothetical protein